MPSSESKVGLIITGIFAVIAALVGASAFDRVFYPVVEVAVAQTHLDEMVITITNYGSQPADNLTLFILHPDSPFTHLTNEFSTSDITLMDLKDGSPEVLNIDQPIDLISQLNSNSSLSIYSSLLNNDSSLSVNASLSINGPLLNNDSSLLNNPNLLELYIKKFYHGTGSKAAIKLGVEKPINWTNFEASAVYAQGSTNWVEARSLTYKGFIDNITQFEHILAIALIVGFVLAVGIRWQQKIKAKKFPGEKEIVTVIGITELVIFGSLYTFDVIRLDTQLILIAVFVAFFSALVPHWQLFKPKNTKLKKISEQEFIVGIGIGILVVIGFLYAFGLSLTKLEHILVIIPTVVFVSWLLPWAYRQHNKRSARAAT